MTVGPLLVALTGGQPRDRATFDEILASAGDLAVATETDADVLVVADDTGCSALDRCRAADRPCVVLLEQATLATVTEAMRAGARGAVARDPLEPFGLLNAIRDAAAFRRARLDQGAAPGRLLVVSGARGGCGTSTVALAVARALSGAVALLDLDLAGGSLGPMLGLPGDPALAGLAAETSGARAFERLAVDVGPIRVVPAPPRPDLAWIVRPGLCADLARAARNACATVVADIGRAAGPALEVVADASLIIVATSPTRIALGAAHRHASFLRGLTGARCDVHLVATPVRLRDEPILRLAAMVDGIEVVGRLPRLTSAGGFAPRSRRQLEPALIGASR